MKHRYMHLTNMSVETLGYVKKKFKESKKVHMKNYIAILFILQQELSPPTDLEFYFQYFNKISEEIIHFVCFLDSMDNI